MIVDIPVTPGGLWEQYRTQSLIRPVAEEMVPDDVTISVSGWMNSVSASALSELSTGHRNLWRNLR